MDMNQVRGELDQLEQKMNKLRFDYDQYIKGNINMPPARLENEVNNLIQKYNRISIPNSTLNFRFKNLTQRFLSYRDRWNRMIMERDGFKKTTTKQPPPIVASETTNRKKTKLDEQLDKLPDNVDKTKVKAAISKKIKELKSQGITDIGIKLKNVDGKIKLSIRQKK